MSCKIIYNNQNYTIESFKDYLVKNKNLFLQDFISQDIEGFKEFVNKSTFDKELAQKIQDKLQRLYPEIKLNITNNPVWEYNDEVFNQLFSKKTKKIALTALISYTLWNTNAKLINSNIQYKDDVTTSYILEKIASDGYVYTDSNGKIINKSDTINTEAYNFLKNLWQKAGYPKIIIKSGEGKSRYNPVTNSITINIKRKDDVHGYIEIEKDKNGNNVYGISADLFIAEIAHSLQAAQGKMYVGKQIIDFIKSGFVYDNSYETEGTLEYEAHEEIEPQLVKEFENYLYEQTVNNKIIGQANIKAMTVLIAASFKATDLQINNMIKEGLIKKEC